ncbi:peptidoglycan DD-metalloendopeptidase family protein [Ferviditalea candida]|uniref:Peptidoglycan DD-metalloendopeptidase family protein n=1 Tax=Ferviditalea candida TaxID=3108399 RepID=A0ABU5ZFD2_9BACL|nr:peptidoglycan DD-metalloendopeptidase family protein [Paenibacillaceae bacterium T2]
MKLKWDSRQFTFMVIPEANRSVVRFRVPGLILYLIPAVLITLVGALLIFFFLNDYNIHAKNLMKRDLIDKTSAYENKLKNKDNTIDKLQNQVIQLSQQADEMKTKVEELKKLEQELKTLGKVGSTSTKVKPVAVLSADNTPASHGQADQTGMGGVTEAISDQDIQQLLTNTSSTFSSLGEDIDNLMDSLGDARQKLLDKQYLLRVTPSIWPTISNRITSGFGYRVDPFTGRPGFHSGVDIGGNLNDPVYVTAEGIVETTGYDVFHGRNIIVKHANGIKTWYMHLNQILVTEGQKVGKGEVIGRLGSTGRSTGPHLHYQVVKRGKTVNPMAYLTPS